jgi:hypothetical protein
MYEAVEQTKYLSVLFSSFFNFRCAKVSNFSFMALALSIYRILVLKRHASGHILSLVVNDAVFFLFLKLGFQRIKQFTIFRH